jgi:hypothetical protein
MKKTTAQQKYAWFPEPPMDVSAHYSLGNYEFSRVSAQIAKKYLDREANLKRAWTRICTHMPETTTSHAPLDILEFSTAHGAMLELWRALGHNAVGTDYCVPEEFRRTYKKLSPDAAVFETEHDHTLADVKPGWVYQPIIESLGCDVRLFNAGETPYPFEDKSFDYVCCYQAIEAYAEPADWASVVDEFCRIARRAVVIGFNPPPLRADDRQGWDATTEAWEKLRRYKRNGFSNVFFEFEETNRGYHPSACKLIFDAS